MKLSKLFKVPEVRSGGTRIFHHSKVCGSEVHTPDYINGSQSVIPRKQGQQHLGTCEKCKFSKPAPELTDSEIPGAGCSKLV